MIRPQNTIRSSNVVKTVAKGSCIIKSRLAANPDGFLIDFFKEVLVFNCHLPKPADPGATTVCIILMVVMASLCVENGGWISVF